jgi:RimJ/RimL family protein N-acetyltransferase
LLFHQAFELGLRKIYLFTEVENNSAQKLFAKLGFKKEGLLKNDLYYIDRFIDRYLFAYDLFSLEKKGNVL